MFRTRQHIVKVRELLLTDFFCEHPEFITRFVDIWYALPFLMVALVVTLIFGRGLTVLMGVLALIAWSGFVRVIRAQTLIIREMDFVASAKVNGATPTRILYKHIFAC